MNLERCEHCRRFVYQVHHCDIADVAEHVKDLKQERDEARASLANLKSLLREAYAINAGFRSVQAERNEALAKCERLRAACSQTEHAVCQILGRALKYPRYADDPKNFPDEADSDDVCTGDHVAVTLAEEAAHELRQLRLQRDLLSIDAARKGER
jgi:hypothetical protein